MMPGPTGVPVYYVIWWSRSPMSGFCLPNYSVSNCTKKLEELRKISKIKHKKTMPLLFSSEVASTHPALVAVNMGIL